MINNDIYIKQIVKVSSDFHARFNVKEKTYIYKINLGEYDPISKNYIYQYNKQLDIDKMKEGLKQFIGEHDFTSFTSGDNIQASYIRTIYNAEINLNNNILTISFTGNGFLRYMVRNMVGILIKIGEHKYQPEDITTILNSKDRTQASITAEPNGLYLKDVKY